MKAGDTVLIRFPQADLRAGKLRPALVVATVPGRHMDLLLVLITSRLYQAVPGFDEIIAEDEPDLLCSFSRQMALAVFCFQDAERPRRLLPRIDGHRQVFPGCPCGADPTSVDAS